jgi:hypothetical protein
MDNDFERIFHVLLPRNLRTLFPQRAAGQVRHIKSPPCGCLHDGLIASQKKSHRREPRDDGFRENEV